MKIISHRGNLDGPNIGNENKKDQISACIDLGLDIEIDLWRIDEKFFLGHDDPETEISEKWLLEKKNYLWIHCKNLEGLEILIKEFSDLNFFWHENDKYTLTNHGYIWAYPGNELSLNSVCVMPEWNDKEFKCISGLKCYGICTDYPLKVKALVEK